MPKRTSAGAPAMVICPRRGASRLGLVTGLRTCKDCHADLEVSPAAAAFLKKADTYVICLACARRLVAGGEVRIEVLPDQEREIQEELGLGIEEFKRASAEALLEP